MDFPQSCLAIATLLAVMFAICIYYEIKTYSGNLIKVKKPKNLKNLDKHYKPKKSKLVYDIYQDKNSGELYYFVLQKRKLPKNFFTYADYNKKTDTFQDNKKHTIHNANKK